MATPPVNLGYDSPTEATIDQVNIWMRSQPWYRALLASWGQDQGPVHLNDAQKQQILRAAQSQGVVVDEGNMEVDPSGNFNPKGHKLRNTLIVAGIAGAAIATMGAAGAFAGAGGAGSAGAGAGAGAGASATAAAGGLLPSTTIGTGFIPAIAGGTGLTTAAAAAPSITGAASTALKVGKSLSAIGTGLGEAGTAAGQNRLDQEQLALTANGQNIAGNSAAETALINRAKLEAGQRLTALSDVARNDYATRRPVSPFNPIGAPSYTPAYRATLTDLASQGSDRLKTKPQYGTPDLSPLAGYTPIDIRNVPGATGTQKGLLERVNDWAGPTLSVTGRILQAFGK